MRRAESRNPYDLIASAQQGPMVARALGQFLIDEKIRKFLGMTVHTQRGEVIARTPRPQLESR